MSKVRINDLARELEVKSRAILDALTHVGVTEKKTHSSSLEEDEAERVRQHFQRSGKNGAGPAKAADSEPKQKIDWSRVSKPGDVLKAIQQRKDEAAAIAQRPPAPQASQPQVAYASPSSAPDRFRRSCGQSGRRCFATAVSVCAASRSERAAGRRSFDCTDTAAAPCPNCAQPGSTRPAASQFGRTNSASSRPAAARAAQDRSSATAGAEDRSRAAAHAGYRC
jgi:translation initiation factor IF-2